MLKRSFSLSIDIQYDDLPIQFPERFLEDVFVTLLDGEEELVPLTFRSSEFGPSKH